MEVVRFYGDKSSCNSFNHIDKHGKRINKDKNNEEVNTCMPYHCHVIKENDKSSKNYEGLKITKNYKIGGPK